MSFVVGTCEVTGELIFGLVDSLTENGAAYLCRLYETSFNAHTEFDSLTKL